MEKKIETIVMGCLGTISRIHPFTSSKPKVSSSQPYALKPSPTCTGAQKAAVEQHKSNLVSGP